MKNTKSSKGYRASAPVPCSATCCAGATYYETGDKLKVHSTQWGHVFVYHEGPNAPGMQYPCCVACGQAWHVVRDAQQNDKDLARQALDSE